MSNASDTKTAQVGVCPECGGADGWLHVERQVWAYCDRCRTRWLSHVRDRLRSPETWADHGERASYVIVVPAPTTMSAVHAAMHRAYNLRTFGQPHHPDGPTRPEEPDQFDLLVGNAKPLTGRRSAMTRRPAKVQPCHVEQERIIKDLQRREG